MRLSSLFFGCSQLSGEDRLCSIVQFLIFKKPYCEFMLLGQNTGKAHLIEPCSEELCRLQHSRSTNLCWLPTLLHVSCPTCVSLCQSCHWHLLLQRYLLLHSWIHLSYNKQPLICLLFGSGYFGAFQTCQIKVKITCFVNEVQMPTFIGLEENFRLYESSSQIVIKNSLESSWKTSKWVIEHQGTFLIWSKCFLTVTSDECLYHL